MTAEVSRQIGRAGEITILSASLWWKAPRQALHFALVRLPTWTANLLRRRDLGQEFKRLDFLYTATFVRVGRFPDFGQPRESRRWCWMVFCGNFNQFWEPYFHSFIDLLAGGVKGAWGPTVDFPPFPQPETRNELLRWLRGQLCGPAAHYYCAYPGATAHDIRAAVRIDREWLGVEHEARAERRRPRPSEVRALERSLQHALSPQLIPPADGSTPCLAKSTGMSNAVVLLPVEPSRVEDLRAVLKGLDGSMGGSARPPSPFSRVPGTHFARLVLIDRRCGTPNPVPKGTPSMPMLRSAWLLFSADFDGAFDEWEFARRKVYRREFERYAPGLNDCDDLRAVWSCCRGYPGRDDPKGFAEWLWKGVVKRYVLYRDYPDRTLPEVTHALRRAHEYLTLIEAGRSIKSRPTAEGADRSRPASAVEGDQSRTTATVSLRLSLSSLLSWFAGLRARRRRPTTPDEPGTG